MTVIFHTNAGTPILAGDMLLSIPGPLVRTDLRLPSQPNGIVIPSNEVPNFIPVKMRRKIFVVNDHMAVGAAGSPWHIRKFIDDLLGAFQDKSQFTYSDIKTFLDSYASSGQGEEVAEQIGLLILAEATDWRGSLTKGLAPHKEVISQHFGRVVAIGTGANSIIDEVENLDKRYQYGMSQPPNSGTRFPEFRSLMQNLVLLANVFWKEIMSPVNIFDAWGGAYDLIYQDSEKVFRHLNDYTIFLRVFDGGKPEQGIQLMNVLRYERRPEVSFVSMLNNGKLDFFGAKDITASDEPVSIRIAREGLTMNSKIHISIIAVGKNRGLIPFMVQVDGIDPDDQGRQTVFTDFDEEGRLRVLFHSEHDGWLTEQAMSYYNSNANIWP